VNYTIFIINTVYTELHKTISYALAIHIVIATQWC